jgi:hypothetical protein
MKEGQSNTQDTVRSGSSDRGSDDMNATPAETATRGVLETLCRMALVEEEATAVNGAYERAPPTQFLSDDR